MPKAYCIMQCCGSGNKPHVLNEVCNAKEASAPVSLRDLYTRSAVSICVHGSCAVYRLAILCDACRLIAAAIMPLPAHQSIRDSQRSTLLHSPYLTGPPPNLRIYSSGSRLRIRHIFILYMWPGLLLTSRSYFVDHPYSLIPSQC